MNEFFATCSVRLNDKLDPRVTEILENGQKEILENSNTMMDPTQYFCFAVIFE